MKVIRSAQEFVEVMENAPHGTTICVDRRNWIEEPPTADEYVQGGDLFEQWSRLNQIVGSFRCRFDRLREELPKCKTRQGATQLLDDEQFGQRYPLLPDWLM